MRVLGIILAIIAIMILMFLAGGFAGWNWNPAEWEVGSRYFLVCGWVVCLVLGAVVICKSSEK